jgi:hypothetical protein
MNESKKWHSEDISDSEKRIIEYNGKMGKTWPRKGDRMRFLGENGYPHELAAAKAKMKDGEVFTVEKFHLGGWHSDIEFEELTGKWNSVMFELI